MSSEKSLTPQIRFKGFTEAWEQCKLDDLAIFNPNADLPAQFEYVDLESVAGTEMLSHRTELRDSAPSRAQRLAQFGDLFYQTVRPYQKNNYLYEKPDNNYVFSTGYAQMRPLVDGYFLLSLVQNEGFIKKVLDNCSGTSYPAINANVLSSIVVNSSSHRKEQIQVGCLFRRIDNLITLHQRKLDALKKIKSALLEKMFPKDGSNIPEIRFTGFTEAWEQRKLSDIATKQTSKNTDSTILEPFTNSAEQGVVSQYDYFDHGITNVANISNYFVICPNDFVYNPRISVTAPCGPINRNRLNRPGIMSPLYTIFRTNQSIDVTYLEYYFKTKKWHPFMFLEGNTGARSDRFSISDSTFFKLPIQIPSKAEQKLISKQLEALSNLIALHQRKLDALKKIKSALLEKMFV